jgi:hypothetical protein
MRDGEHIFADAIVSQQQPAAEAFLIAVQSIARGGLRDLAEKREDVAFEYTSEAGQAVDCGYEGRCVHFKRPSAYRGKRAD